MGGITLTEWAIESHNDYARVRECLLAMDTAGVLFAFHGEMDGDDYRQTYRFDDFDIRLENENLEFIDEEYEDPDTGEILVLSKPLLVLYTKYEQSSSPRIRGTYAMDWQITVNASTDGRLNLDGYSQLCQSIFELNDIAQANTSRFWSEFGLLPRSFRLSDIYDGEVFDTSLKNRLLCRMAHCVISIL